MVSCARLARAGTYLAVPYSIFREIDFLAHLLVLHHTENNMYHSKDWRVCTSDLMEFPSLIILMRGHGKRALAIGSAMIL